MNNEYPYNILYNETIDATVVHSFQVMAETLQEAITAGRKELGNVPYFISVTPHMGGLNEVHPDYF